jgi:hypothetical protein
MDRFIETASRFPALVRREKTKPLAFTFTDVPRLISRSSVALISERRRQLCTTKVDHRAGGL